MSYYGLTQGCATKKAARSRPCRSPRRKLYAASTTSSGARRAAGARELMRVVCPVRGAISLRLGLVAANDRRQRRAVADNPRQSGIMDQSHLFALGIVGLKNSALSKASAVSRGPSGLSLTRREPFVARRAAILDVGRLHLGAVSHLG
jgi:hypothetical protein